MDCGDGVALSVMVMVAGAAPEAMGAKWPWMLQLAPTARLAPQLLAKTNCDAPAPVTAMLAIDKVAVPVLVNVTDWELLDVPRATVPNERLVDDRVTDPTDTPIPLNAKL